tara:strand:- start:2005 stop:2190 length:186 start_codon:yes stop_codon:yes gene_type:complete
MPITREMIVHVQDTDADRRESFLNAVSMELVLSGVRIQKGFYEVIIRKIPKKEEKYIITEN